MSSLISITLALLLIGLAIWLLLIYTVGNAWHRSHVGRALVTLAGNVLFIEIYSLVRRLANWPAWTAQVEQGIIAVALLALCVAFHRERRRMRRGEQDGQS